MSNTYTVIAKEDLEVRPHTWTKGLDYQVVQKEDYFILASNEGSVNYYNSVKGDVLACFSYKIIDAKSILAASEEIDVNSFINKFILKRDGILKKRNHSLGLNQSVEIQFNLIKRIEDKDEE